MTKEQFLSLPNYKKFQCVNIHTGEKERFSKEDADTAFIYGKRKRRYGWRVSSKYILDNFELIVQTPKDVDKSWHRRIKSIIKALDESGLWPDLKAQYENLYLMSYDDKKEIKELYWSQHDNNQTVDDYNKKAQKWFDKYPFVQLFDEYGNPGVHNEYLQIDTFYIWEMSEAQTKSMYFGKYTNAKIKEELKKAIEEKRDYSYVTRVNYDVSIEYKADKNAAWYSEEYRDCGNGHYYLALNHSMAIFCEDD